MQAIQLGDRVRIHYATRSNQGNIIETSDQREPFEFTVGDRNVIDGVNDAMIGMQIGEKKQVTIPPEQAFGFRDSRLQQVTPRGILPDRIEEGDQLTATISGCQIDYWVRHVRDNEILLDANHPLAGETLILELEVIGFGFEDVK